jgi:hypothetical protein
MTYRIPVQFESRRYRGKTKREIRNIEVHAVSPLEAARTARDIASRRIGKRIANITCQVFTVASVEVRMDLFREPRS